MVILIPKTQALAIGRLARKWYQEDPEDSWTRGSVGNDTSRFPKAAQGVQEVGEMWSLQTGIQAPPSLQQPVT